MKNIDANDLEIRRLSPQDMPQLLQRLRRDETETTAVDAVEKLYAESICYVAEKQSLIGFLRARKDGDHLYVLELWAKEAYEEGSLYKALIQALQKDHPSHTVLIVSALHNKIASLGAVRTSEVFEWGKDAADWIFPMSRGRETLKDYDRDQIDFSLTDQYRGKPMPPIQKAADLPYVRLPAVEDLKFDASFTQSIQTRKSHRRYLNKNLTLEELSYLLWVTHGVRERYGSHVFRTAPSAGNRHAIDSYVSVHAVEELDMGIYRYQPLEHALVKIAEYEDLPLRCALAARRQNMAGNSAVTFFWVGVPKRMEWRYAYASYKVMALDAGHIAQNLYLAASAVGCGCCAIAAYDQDDADALLNLDGEEFVIYMASLGKV